MDINIENYEINIEEFIDILNSDNNSFVILDLRNEIEIMHGKLPKSIHINEQELLSNPLNEENKKYIVCCSRGIFSKEVVKKLRDNNFNNYYSLEGGYHNYLLYIIKNNIQNKTNTDNVILKKVEKSIQTTFRKKLMSNFLKAIKQYELIKDNDNIAVCISGGKDSFLMAMLFKELKKWTKINFNVQYISMDPGYNEENRKLLEYNSKILDIPIKIFKSSIFDIVYNEKKSPCYLCARMRRGYLYSFAKQNNCNKIALAHHYDDVIETILMGILYGGQMQSMLPKLKSTNFENMELIRPMYLIKENDIISWKEQNNLSFLQCACKFTENCSSCSNNETKSKRLETKNIIKNLKKSNEYIENNIFKSAENVQLDTLISYKSNNIKHSFLDNY